MVELENIPIERLEIPYVDHENKNEIPEFVKDNNSREINYTDDLLSKEFMINYFKKTIINEVKN
jgi:hypothetical protein